MSTSRWFRHKSSACGWRKNEPESSSTAGFEAPRSVQLVENRSTSPKSQRNYEFTRGPSPGRVIAQTGLINYPWKFECDASENACIHVFSAIGWWAKMKRERSIPPPQEGFRRCAIFERERKPSLVAHPVVETNAEKIGSSFNKGLSDVGLEQESG